MSGERRNAKAGEAISAKAAAKLRKTARIFEQILATKDGCTIAPKSQTVTGQWVCADCGRVLPNNFSAATHTTRHRLAWWTGERFEEP